ncbi:hypothetical protein CYY_002746 [Polysphondylium violaceum]|uniref:ADP-ribosylation factor-related protein n=1 Tax=Polysphondylium violaceum TaxID=133409 RepID=A0A8J4V1Z5_9MYCE|nr:hypothetical protein CYY_002746 [Polysphondylium violaceum]
MEIGSRDSILYKHYYQDCDAYIFIIDPEDRERNQLLKSEFSSIFHHDKRHIAPILIHINQKTRDENKTDYCFNQQQRQQIIQLLDLENIPKDWFISSISSSAIEKSDDGIAQGLEWLYCKLNK